MSISPWQIAVIVILLILLFGPKRLPGLGKAIGEAIRNFKKGLDGKDKGTQSAQSEKLDSSDTPKSEDS